MRKYFFDRFGAGQPEVLAERTKIYLLGMPGKDGEVFPPRCNMENKLDKLETEREFLLEMCPKDKNASFCWKCALKIKEILTRKVKSIP
jgi:hypothetical protein